jgi:hypothetical protein
MMEQELGEETKVLRENLPVISSAPIPHDITWDRTQAAAVGS